MNLWMDMMLYIWFGVFNNGFLVNIGVFNYIVYTFSGKNFQRGIKVRYDASR